MAAPHDNPAFTDLQPGDKVDKYVLVEAIGSGGSSVVWKAYDALLDRHVAIKHLMPLPGDADDPEELAHRFEQEMRVYRELSERVPRVVELYDCIENEQGRYIVMQYVEGRTLEQVLVQREGPLDLTAAVTIFRAVARVLGHVHDQGVIHRDVKPSNILLPAEGGLLLCDLGLASLIESQGSLSIGTARYLAPEWCRGEPADARADLYALGLIAAELIAGRDAFNQAMRSVLRDDSRQAMRWVKWHTNPRLKLPSLTSMNPHAPAWLAELIARMTEKDPTRRLRTTDEVVQVIDRYAKGDTADGPAAQASAAAGGGTVAGTSGPATAALPSRTRGWRTWAAAAAVGLGLLLVTGALLWPAGEAGPSPEQLRARAVEQMRDAQAHYQAGDYHEAASIYAAVLQDWSDDPALSDSANAGQLLAEARIAMAHGDYEQAKAKLARVDELGVVSVNEINQLLRQVERRLTFHDHVREIEQIMAEGRFAEARRLIREWRRVTLTAEEEARLREMGVRLEDRVNQALVDDAISRANTLLEDGRRAEAIEMLRRAQKRHLSPRLQSMIDRLETDRRYEAALARAQSMADTAETDELVGAYEAVLDIRTDPSVEAELNALRAQRAIERGRLLMQQGDLDGARAAFARATGFGQSAEAERFLAQMDAQERFELRVAAGDFAMRDGDYAAAAEQYRQALAITDDDAVQDNLALAQARRWVARGDTLRDAGKMREAREAYAQAQVLSRSVPEASEALREVDRQLAYREALQAGDELRAESRLDQAKRHYLRAKNIVDTPEARQRIDDVEFHQAIAQVRVFMDEEQWKAARAMLSVATRIYPDHPALADLRNRLAGVRDEEQG